MMKLAKFSLIASAVGFAGFGIVLFVAPGLLETAGITIVSPAGEIELRAFYGGIEIGLALFFLFALRRPAWIRPALVVQICTAGAVVLARAMALILAGFQANSVIYLSWAAEATLLIIGIIALTKLPTSKAPV